MGRQDDGVIRLPSAHAQPRSRRTARRAHPRNSSARRRPARPCAPRPIAVSTMARVASPTPMPGPRQIALNRLSRRISASVLRPVAGPHHDRGQMRGVLRQRVRRARHRHQTRPDPERRTRRQPRGPGAPRGARDDHRVAVVVLVPARAWRRLGARWPSARPGRPSEQGRSPARGPLVHGGLSAHRGEPPPFQQPQVHHCQSPATGGTIGEDMPHLRHLERDRQRTERHASPTTARRRPPASIRPLSRSRPEGASTATSRGAKGASRPDRPDRAAAPGDRPPAPA
jgi:hypothetical protein